MITRTLDQPTTDSLIIVKGALELVEDVKTYHDNGDNVVTAKTGFRFGLLASSYGESITVSLRQVSPGTTEITVRGEKNIGVNVGADPDKYVLEFVQTLDTLAEYPMEDVVDLLEERTAGHTKEVQDERDQTDGASMLAIIFALILLSGFLWIVLI